MWRSVSTVLFHGQNVAISHGESFIMYHFYDYMEHNPVLATNSVALFYIFSLALSLLLSSIALSISRSTVRLYISKITLSLSGTPDPLRALAWSYNIADTWKFRGHSIFHYFLYIQRHVIATVAENGVGRVIRNIGMRKNKKRRTECRINNV